MPPRRGSDHFCARLPPLPGYSAVPVLPGFVLPIMSRIGVWERGGGKGWGDAAPLPLHVVIAP